MSENPYSAPKAPTGNPNAFGDDLEKIEAVAKAQKMLLRSILCSIGGNAVLRSGETLGYFVLPIALAIAVFAIWCVYKLCKALEANPVVWCIAMFIPLINLIALVILNQRATTFLKSRGVDVGFFGAKL